MTALTPCAPLHVTKTGGQGGHTRWLGLEGWGAGSGSPLPGTNIGRQGQGGGYGKIGGPESGMRQGLTPVGSAADC
jgi:hypothetical protein